MFTCETWREESPRALAAFLATAWTLLAAAFLAPPPRGGRGAFGAAACLAGVLVLADAALDGASVYAPRLAHLGWEMARVAAVLVAGALAVPLARAGRGARRAILVARVAGVAGGLVVPIAMAVVALDGARDESGEGPADAAVVLGFTLADDGTPRPQIVARVERGVELWRAGVVPRLVLTGGAPKAGRTEASVMRELAEARGAPASALVLEPNARSTIENFACARPLLDALGARRVLVVTEPWHMTRAMLLARRHGLDARRAPASSEVWRDPRRAAYWVFRDAVAYARELARDPWATPGRCATGACEGCRAL